MGRDLPLVFRDHSPPLKCWAVFIPNPQGPDNKRASTRQIQSPMSGAVPLALRDECLAPGWLASLWTGASCQKTALFLFPVFQKPFENPCFNDKLGVLQLALFGDFTFFAGPAHLAGHAVDLAKAERQNLGTGWPGLRGNDPEAPGYAMLLRPRTGALREPGFPRPWPLANAQLLDFVVKKTPACGHQSGCNYKLLFVFVKHRQREMPQAFIRPYGCQRR